MYIKEATPGAHQLKCLETEMKRNPGKQSEGKRPGTYRTVVWVIIYFSGETEARYDLSNGEKTTVQPEFDIQKKYPSEVMTKYILREIQTKKLLPSDLH